MQKIIALNCSPIDNVRYAFATEDYVVGEKVVVDISGVICVGSVLCAAKQIDPKDLTEELATIQRRATQFDLSTAEQNRAKAEAAVTETKQKVKQLKLKMKVVGAYYSLDLSKVVIDFTADDRVDFRELLKELASSLRTRIELRQIGQRDEVKIKGGIGPCGEICCCKRFLNDFGHVSVKMAKTQGLSLSPTKISGLCGRLMCCLAYENSNYEEILKKMPKVGASIKTPNGEGVVIYNDILREQVRVRFGSKEETTSIEEFNLEELADPAKYKARQQQKIDSLTTISVEAVSSNGAEDKKDNANKTQPNNSTKQTAVNSKQNEVNAIKPQNNHANNKNKHGNGGQNKNVSTNQSYGLQFVDLDQTSNVAKQADGQGKAANAGNTQQQGGSNKGGQNKFRHKNNHNRHRHGHGKGKPNSAGAETPKNQN